MARNLRLNKSEQMAIVAWGQVAGMLGGTYPISAISGGDITYGEWEEDQYGQQYRYLSRTIKLKLLGGSSVTVRMYGYQSGFDFRGNEWFVEEVIVPNGGGCFSYTDKPIITANFPGVSCYPNKGSLRRVS